MQPVSGYRWGTISGGVGTYVVANNSCVLAKVVLPGTYVGTMVFQDAASAAGTSATTPFMTLPIPATVLSQSIDLNLQCRNGLVIEATGTPVALYLIK